MLIDDITDFCNQEYQTFGNKCGCRQCNHPSKKCSGSCCECLHQIHFPGEFDSGPIKRLYDCPKMIYYYVCRYSYLYATELLCAFQEKTDYLRDYPYYHILSLGCGGCTDLIAFEKFYKDIGADIPISYIGIDVNPLWKPVNNRIQDYSEKNNIKYQVHYCDAVTYFRQSGIANANILVISYLISYLYNTEQISAIDTFAKDVVNNIVQKKREGQKFLIIINDVNSNRRGRDYFNCFVGELNKRKLLTIKQTYKYFDTGELCPPQKIGTPYKIHKSLFSIPNGIKEKYHAPICCQQTIQLILEVT